MKIESAIYYNNSGLAYLEQGRHEDALKMFKEAAQLMYAITQAINQRENITPDEAPDQSESRPYLSSNQYPQHEQLKRSLQRPLCDGKEESFVFALPIYMDLSFRTSTNCTVESAIILYNMALTYHLDSLRPFGLENALHNALTLYEMVYSLALQVPLDNRSQQIIIAAANNLGHIHHEKGDFTKSRECFEDLSLYILSLGCPQEKTVAEERHEFLLNAMVFKNPQNAAAA